MRLSIGPSSGLALVAILTHMSGPAQAVNELLAEHISDYSSSPSTNLPGCADTTTSLVGEFDDAGGWSRHWWANLDVWESDYKRTSLPGGDDVNWTDAHDFDYLCGHGNVGLVELTSFMPQNILRANEVQLGDVDAEWVTFDTSMTLRDTGGNINDWAINALNRLHLLIGWHDSPLDGDTGGEFADELIDWGLFDGGGENVRIAWFSGSGGCTDQNSGTTQMILAEDDDFFDDHIWGEGSVNPDQPVDSAFWTWSHDC